MLDKKILQKSLNEESLDAGGQGWSDGDPVFVNWALSNDFDLNEYVEAGISSWGNTDIQTKSFKSVEEAFSFLRKLEKAYVLKGWDAAWGENGTGFTAFAPVRKQGYDYRNNSAVTYEIRVPRDLQIIMDKKDKIAIYSEISDIPSDDILEEGGYKFVRRVSPYITINRRPRTYREWFIKK